MKRLSACCLAAMVFLSIEVVGPSCRAGTANADKPVLAKEYLASREKTFEKPEFTEEERALAARLFEMNDKEFFRAAFPLSVAEKLTCMQYLDFTSDETSLEARGDLSRDDHRYKARIRKLALRGAMPTGKVLHKELLAIIGDSDRSADIRIDAILLYWKAYTSLPDCSADRALEAVLRELLFSEKNVNLRETAYRVLVALLPLTEERSSELLTRLLVEEEDAYLRERLAHVCLCYGFICGLLPTAEIRSALYSEDPEEFEYFKPENVAAPYGVKVPEEYTQTWPALKAFLKENISKFHLENQAAVMERKALPVWRYVPDGDTFKDSSGGKEGKETTEQ